MSTNRRIDQKMWYIPTIEYYSAKEQRLLLLPIHAKIVAQSRRHYGIHRRVHIEYFHLYNVPKQANLIYGRGKKNIKKIVI